MRGPNSVFWLGVNDFFFSTLKVEGKLARIECEARASSVKPRNRGLQSAVVGHILQPPSDSGGMQQACHDQLTALFSCVRFFGVRFGVGKISFLFR